MSLHSHALRCRDGLKVDEQTAEAMDLAKETKRLLATINEFEHRGDYFEDKSRGRFVRSLVFTESEWLGDSAAKSVKEDDRGTLVVICSGVIGNRGRVREFIVDNEDEVSEVKNEILDKGDFKLVKEKGVIHNKELYEQKFKEYLLNSRKTAQKRKQVSDDRANSK